jgi:hypothetical protein
MTRLKIESIGGNPSEGDTFAQLIEYLTLAEEAVNTLGHLRKANDDEFLGQGFLAIGEMLHKTRMNVIKLSMSKSGGFIQ